MVFDVGEQPILLIHTAYEYLLVPFPLEAF